MEQISQAAGRVGLRYVMYYTEEVHSSGMMTLSWHPITSSGYMAYTASRDDMELKCGDFVAENGEIICVDLSCACSSGDQTGI